MSDLRFRRRPPLSPMKKLARQVEQKAAESEVAALQTAIADKADGDHTHTISDVEGLQIAFDEKSDTGHTHTIADVAGLQTALESVGGGGPHTHPIDDVEGLQAALDGKSATGHTHAVADVTGLQNALDGKSATGHTHADKADVSHGHAVADVAGLQTTLDGKSATGHGHAIADITNLQTALNSKAENESVANLDTSVQDLSSQLSGKADVTHGHEIADVAGLQGALDGKAALAHTHSGIPSMARVTVDTANSSNTVFQNLFSKAVLANEIWSFEATIYFSAAAATTGLVVQVDSPTSPTASQISFVTMESVTATRNLTGAQGVALVGTASGAATVLEANVSGTIEVGSTPGNIVIKFRSEVSGSAITVKRGSWAKFFKH